MNHYFVCGDCVERYKKPIEHMSVQEWADVKSSMVFKSKIPASCPECGGTNTIQVFGVSASYIKGYGYLDKKGAKNDMDLHTMISNKDPYKEHRKSGENKDIILKLQKSKEFNAHPKTIHIGKQ